MRMSISLFLNLFPRLNSTAAFDICVENFIDCSVCFSSSSLTSIDTPSFFSILCATVYCSKRMEVGLCGSVNRDCSKPETAGEEYRGIILGNIRQILVE